MTWSPDNITQIVIALISFGLGSLIVAWSTGRKTRAETENIEAKTAREYQEMAGAMEDRYTASLQRLDAALLQLDADQKEIRALRQDVDLLKEQVHAKDLTIEYLTKENIRLGAKVKSLTDRVRDLESQLRNGGTSTGETTPVT
jgi:chromosome segregation ATPase